jgi:hypothetical protein
MRTLYDVYNIDECGEIASTPANTIGMGNPMLPTAEEPGTEPIIPTAKTKTEKKQKKQKVKEEIKEGILADMNDTIQAGDDLVEFADWYATNLLVYYNKFDKSELMNNLLGMISIENKDTVIIDVSKDESTIGNSLIIKNPNIPGKIKTLKYINANKKVSANIYVLSYVGNLANMNIEVYRDNGKSYGNLMFKVNKSGGQHAMLGKITCDCLDFEFRGDSLSINNDSIILELNLKHSYNLTNLYTKLPHITSATVCKKLIQRQLSEAGIWPWGIKLDIR